MPDQSTVKAKPHPFAPRFDGKACRHLTYANHRSTECGGQPNDPTHTRTRPDPPELEYPYPPCSLCGKDTYHDGDSLRCDACGAYWGTTGPGSWDEPDATACDSIHKPFDREGLDLKHESIRHHIAHCLLPMDHEGTHRSDEFTEWHDRAQVSA